MTLEMAIVTAHKYAIEWGTQLGTVTSVCQVRPWWRLFRLTTVLLEFTSDFGHGTVRIHHRRGVEEFDLELDNPKGRMPPMWAAFPGRHMTNMFWRNGDMMPPERYKYAWHDWYRKLSSEEKLMYQIQYPAPMDWEGFYAEVADISAEGDSLIDYLLNRVL